MKDAEITDKNVDPEDYCEVACAVSLPFLALILLLICDAGLLGIIIIGPILGYVGVKLGRKSAAFNSFSKVCLVIVGIVTAGLVLLVWAIAESGEKKPKKLPAQHIVYQREQIIVLKRNR